MSKPKPLNYKFKELLLACAVVHDQTHLNAKRGQ